MRQIGLREVQTALVDAFEDGLRSRYGPALAPLYRRVIEFRPHTVLETEELRRTLELDAVPVLKDIFENKVSGATLGGLRSLIVGSALQENKEAVIRWATEGLNRSPASPDEWQAVLKDPERFIQIARQIKYFLNQI